MDSQYYFYVCNGAVLRDENDLLNELRQINPSVFSYHVNSEKNDFYNWVKEVLKDEALAKKISKIKDKDEMIKIVNQQIKFISKSKSKKNIISQIKDAIVNG